MSRVGVAAFRPGWEGLGVFYVFVVLQNSQITCLLISTKTNCLTNALAKCISPEELSGVPHVLFKDLQIGPNKEP